MFTQVLYKFCFLDFIYARESHSHFYDWFFYGFNCHLVESHKS